MSGVMAPTYQSGFASPQRGRMKYPSLWRRCVGAWNPSLGQSGLVLRDWSGNSNHGTLTNMTPGDDWVISQGRYSLDFDGTNDHVTTPCVFDLTGNWSWSFWFRQTAYAHLLGQGDGGGVAIKGVYVQSDGSGKIALVHSGASQIESAATTLNAWHHVAVVKAGTIASLYVDGLLIGSASITATSTAVFEIGRIMFGNVYYYSGPKMIDDIRGYHVGISANAVRLLMSRRGIAYELAPRKVYSIPAAVGTRQYKLLRPSILRGA